jgi:hypothetical protein
MMTIRRLVATYACAGLLSACAGGAGPTSPLADKDKQIDGKVMEAKPGMGRVYLVHGNMFPMQKTRTNAPVHGPVIGIIAAAIVAGAVQASADAERKAVDADPEIKSTGIYYVDGRELGIMGPKQFMALDLPPGKYVFGYQPSKQGKAKMTQTVELQSGDVRAFWSRIDQAGMFAEDKWTGMHLCPDLCVPRIQDGTRVVANILPSAFP